MSIVPDLMLDNCQSCILGVVPLVFVINTGLSLSFLIYESFNLCYRPRFLSLVHLRSFEDFTFYTLLCCAWLV